MGLEEVTLRGILSFGPGTQPLPLQPLNLLIGPNGSGKSNLLEAIGLLRSSAVELTRPLRGRGGSGVGEWIWKGAPRGTASIDAVLARPLPLHALRHRIEFREAASRFELVDEAIVDERPTPGHPDPYFYYRFQRGRPALNVRGQDAKGRVVADATDRHDTLGSPGRRDDRPAGSRRRV